MAGDGGAAEQAARRFAAEAQRIGAVTAVAILPADESLGVVTVLSSDPSGSARSAVYALDLKTHQQHPKALIDFRVIDASEYPPARRPTLLPSGAYLLYRRPSSDQHPAAPASHAD